MINSKIALSALSIVSALMIVGGATFAFFSDSNSSNNNIFAAGDLDLQLDDADEALTSDSVSASIGGSNMAPGDSVGGPISLHNDGSIDMAEVKFGANQTDNNNGGDGNLADVLNIKVGIDTDDDCVGLSQNLTPTIAGTVGDDSLPLTLSELNGEDYDSLPGLAAGETYFLCIGATMQSDAGNAYQGDNIKEDFVFEAHQDASQ